MIILLSLVLGFLGFFAESMFVLPHGAGTKDGSSWQNAMEGSTASLQKALDELRPGETLYIGSGTYRNISLRVNSSGSTRKYITVLGKDTGGGLPVFTSDFDKALPAKTGLTFIELQQGVSQIWIQDIRLKNFQTGIKSASGRHRDLRIINVDADGCRECISLDGGATVADPQSGSNDIEIRGCDLVNYTKRGLRLKNGNYNVIVIDSTADAGGKAWATEPFQMGFQVAGADANSSSAPDHHITFQNCLARNNYDDAGDKYWNADGFVAEKGTYSLKFIDCRSFDNTDGGWDDKSTGTTYEGCIAMRNKRNFRIWGEVRMVRSLAAFSVFPGGSGDDNGLWAEGKVVAENCTFHNNGVGIKATKDASITLINSIVSQEKARNGLLKSIEPSAKLANNESIFWPDSGSDPAYVNASAQWMGVGSNFDSKTFGRKRGFYKK